MPLYEVTDEELVPFRRISSGSDLYEREIEDLMWDNIEAFTGDALFRVCRQPTLATGGRPDIVALDRNGRVHVIEIKRDIDRGQLAQCLEYAGWAKGTNLDELAGMFHEGQDEFFSAWTEFTESTAPQLVSDSPRLTLVARDFDDRTAGALDFLTDSNLPISVLRVTVYEDQERRRFVDFDYESQKELIPTAGGEGPVWTGRFIFENEWQSYRTKQDRALELASAPHMYDEPGSYKVGVKVIDIFGNDTTRVFDVEVG